VVLSSSISSYLFVLTCNTSLKPLLKTRPTLLRLKKTKKILNLTLNYSREMNTTQKTSLGKNVILSPVSRDPLLSIELF
jgi:hypothetical protein